MRPLLPSSPSQGDVLVHLIETANEELGKPTREISTTRLQVKGQEGWRGGHMRETSATRLQVRG